MIRLSALFVAICMVLIAGSFGAVLYLGFNLSGAEASVVGLAALTGLATYYAVATRMRYQSELSGQLGDLSRGTADLARQVGEQGRRIAALEKSSDTAVQKAIAVSQPLQTEIGELGGLLKQLAQNVAAQEAALRSLAAQQQASAPLVPDMAAHAPSVSVVRQEAAAVPPASAPVAIPATNARPADTGPFLGMDSAAVAGLIRDAITDNRIDVYLQPIVTLPQRKVKHYEALMRLRLPDNRIIAAADFLPHAEAAGLMPSLDYFVVSRCVRILRRLQSKNKDVGVFCNVSAETLSDRDMAAQISDFADANRVLAPVLVFELAYPALRAAGPHENERLAKLTDMGFRLSVDHIPDLRFDARDLADRKCGFLKIPAAVLLDRNSQAAADIHPADIAGLLARNGIELIAERVETEETVVDLLDYDLKSAQGNLFSPPRPVKAENGKADRDEVDAAPPAPASQAEAPAPPPQLAGSSALARLARVVTRQ